jgi:hypothetical protein
LTLRARAVVACCAAMLVAVPVGVPAAAARPAFVQDGPKLTGKGELGASELGNAVALSADGSVALVGGYNDNSLIGQLEGLRVHSQAIGAFWPFARVGSKWRQTQPKVLASGERGPGEFGNSVALSADGKVAVVGGPSGYGGIGAAWVFTRAGSTWKQQAKLLPKGAEQATGYVSDPIGFGSSVALSANGRTALIGGPTANGGAGAVWVFTRSGSRWRQAAKLTTNDESGPAQFGVSLALSAAGDTALVGAPFDGSGVGAVFPFARSGSGWKQGAKLTAKREDGYARFGYGLALSGAGTTALVGGPVDASGTGAVWAFTRSGSSWSRAGGKLTARGEVGAGQFGDSVALSRDGSTAVVGGALDNGSRGAAWVLRPRGSTWSQAGDKLTGTDAEGQSQFGASVALSAAGKTALIGGLEDADFAGAAWVFTL